jgi:predicted DCC family thiol-disulfide oxidoreductase YuxK
LPLTTNGWTGGQYSVFRVAFGVYLCVHFLSLAPAGPELFSNRGMLPDASASPLDLLFPNVLTVFDPPVFVTLLILMAACASVLFAMGFCDRAMAVLLWYVWACLLGRNPLISNPGIPYVGWLLLAHVLLPSAPYGSVAARRRADPGGAWRMPPLLFAGAWVLMALGYTYSGATKLGSPSWLDGTAITHILENPLARPGTLREGILALPEGLLKLGTWATLAFELLFAPLALSRRGRPSIWAMGLTMHVGLIALMDFADLSLGMVMLHFFTFDPAWVPPSKARATETLFYDGQCGLCHAAVRFLLAEDPIPGGAFRFAPLGGQTFRAAIPKPSDLPDSLVLLTDNGRILTRSRATLHIGRRLGGLWRLTALLVGLLPVALLDHGYNAVARIRYRLFARPEGTCPIAAPELRSRLLG